MLPQFPWLIFLLFLYRTDILAINIQRLHIHIFGSSLQNDRRNVQLYIICTVGMLHMKCHCVLVIRALICTIHGMGSVPNSGSICSFSGRALLGMTWPCNMSTRQFPKFAHGIHKQKIVQFIAWHIFCYILSGVYYTTLWWSKWMNSLVINTKHTFTSWIVTVSPWELKMDNHASLLAFVQELSILLHTDNNKLSHYYIYHYICYLCHPLMKFSAFWGDCFGREMTTLT